MPAKNKDLHGLAPDQSDVALLIIDVINTFDFPGGKPLAAKAIRMADEIAGLKAKFKRRKLPVIYVNDHRGKWRSDTKTLITDCENSSGKEVLERLRPEEDDYLVLKPKHSAFFATPLDTLLRYLETRTLVITGVGGNLCLLFTVNDAYLRDYHLYVPEDCMASLGDFEQSYALYHMKHALKVNTSPWRRALRAIEKIEKAA